MPDRVVVVAGTGTEVGKTWMTAAAARGLRERGLVVSARKPAQSFDPSEPAGMRDAAILAMATGELADDVCLPHRSFELAMAPPMASAALGRPRIALADLVDELRWPDGVDLGFVETAGGVCSPIADDGDNADLIAALAPDVALLVADAGLGTINAVRLSLLALAGHPLLVVLNRFDALDRLHVANRDWLVDRAGLEVVTSAAELVIRLGRGGRPGR